MTEGSDSGKAPREWFAIKRSKTSINYQFYEPNLRNRETIAEIAPKGGNFEEIELIERRHYDRLAQELASARAEITKLQIDNLLVVSIGEKLADERDELRAEIERLKERK